MDENSFWGAVTLALELFDFTRRDQRWSSRRRELNRAREVFAGGVLGGKEYGTDLKDLEKYFMPFALYAASRKECVFMIYELSDWSLFTKK